MSNTSPSEHDSLKHGLKQAILKQVHEANLGLVQPRASRRRRLRRPPAPPAEPPANLGTDSRSKLAWVLALLLSFAAALYLDPSTPQRGDEPPLTKISLVAHKKQSAPVNEAAAQVPVNLRVPQADDSDRLSTQGRLLAALAQPSLTDYTRFFLKPTRPVAEIFGLGVRTVVIDPGHGGKDPGARGPLGTVEKDLTLDIARRLKARLQKERDLQVVLTRDTDLSLPLSRRVALANAANADLFISIHTNYLPNGRVNALETYYFGPHQDEDTLQLAERENRDSQYGMGEFRALLEKAGDTVKLQESRTLALAIQDSLSRNIKRYNRHVFDLGIKAAPFIVLLGVNAVSVLAEVSCLSSADEERRLNTEQYREEIASYLEQGITNYLHRSPLKGAVAYETERVAKD